MARVYLQNIPDGLKALWEQVTTTRKTRRAGFDTVNLSPEVLSGPAADPQTLQAEAASNFAAWLTDRHAAGLGATARSQFLADRRAEILAGYANPAYWSEAGTVADTVAFGYPVVKPYDGNWNSAYVDPLRQPSRCTYGLPSLTYPMSQAGSAPDKPLPGWAGGVAGTVFQDLWYAQRRAVFALPRALDKVSDWPVLFVCESSIAASATVRGNRNWFVVFLDAYFSRSSGYFGPSFNELYPRWPRDRGYQPSLPDDAPGGWTHTLSRTLVQDGRHDPTWIDATANAYCGLRIMIPPSLGTYFSRNDAATVTHATTPRVFVAKP